MVNSLISNVFDAFCNSVHLNKVMCGQKQPRGITKALTDFQKVLECHKFSEMKAI